MSQSKVEPGGKVDQEMPCNSARFAQRQITEVEPDMEPGPSSSKTTSPHESLGTPLLQDKMEPGKEQSSAPSRHTKNCFRVLAVLLLWAAAALLGVTVAST